MQSLQNKTVLVTGASSGIGRAAAKAFAEQGMRLALSARSEDRLAQLARELGPDTIVLPADLTRPEDVDALIASAISRLAGSTCFSPMPASTMRDRLWMAIRTNGSSCLR